MQDHYIGPECLLVCQPGNCLALAQLMLDNAMKTQGTSHDLDNNNANVIDLTLNKTRIRAHLISQELGRSLSDDMQIQNSNFE